MALLAQVLITPHYFKNPIVPYGALSSFPIREDTIGSSSSSPYRVHVHPSQRLRAGTEVHW